LAVVERDTVKSPPLATLAGARGMYHSTVSTTLPTTKHSLVGTNKTKRNGRNFSTGYIEGAAT
jgi:hypothetical protein